LGTDPHPADHGKALSQGFLHGTLATLAGFPLYCFRHRSLDSPGWGMHNLIGSHSHEGVRHEIELRLLHWYLNTSGIPPGDRDPRDVPPFYAMPHPARHPGDRRAIMDL